MSSQKSISGHSSAIQKTMVSIQNKVANDNQFKQKDFTIKIANTLEEREAAFRLAYQIYLVKGFINKNSNEWLIKKYDFEKDTVILIVQDKQKKIAGSVTLIFDGDIKLPAEKIYREELKALKETKYKMAEISRLVIDNEYQNSKEILVLLFNYLCIYIHHVMNYNCQIIEVNPRHKEFYKKTLSFDEIGGEKPCPQVQNAPAILLYMPTDRYQSEVKRCGGQQITDKKERSFFQFFLKKEQESLVANYLKKQSTPMSIEEKIYFGYSQSGNYKAVCV